MVGHVSVMCKALDHTTPHTHTQITPNNFVMFLATSNISSSQQTNERNKFIPIYTELALAQVIPLVFLLRVMANIHLF